MSARLAAPEPRGPAPAADAQPVYTRLLDTLAADGVPHLVGGSMAIVQYTGVPRAMKDLDLFLRPRDIERALAALDRAGFTTERTHPHWLGKARADGHCIDLIFNSGNGLSAVDDTWFTHAKEAELFGRPVRIVPAEELLWTKIFIMERERYDGADVAHLLRDVAGTLDWRRLRDRVGPHWRVLLSHLVLFGFIYPGEGHRIPSWLLGELTRKLAQETASRPVAGRICRGTLLSRQQYLHDVLRDGYADARAAPLGSMSSQDIAAWTAAIPEDQACRNHGGVR
jgi:hypothetical protein